MIFLKRPNLENKFNNAVKTFTRYVTVCAEKLDVSANDLGNITHY